MSNLFKHKVNKRIDGTIDKAIDKLVDSTLKDLDKKTKNQSKPD